MKYCSVLLLLLLFGCSAAKVQKEPEMISMQTIDRNSFSETISSKERLATFSKVDFLSAQPYQKVLRVFPRNDQGQSVSRITSYHPNGGICQFLEVVEGRAHGIYREWHPNGKLKVEATVLEGLADVNEAAQASWLFEGISKVWDQEGSLLAEFNYEKGVLHGVSRYFHKDGPIARIVPYQHSEIEGTVELFSKSGKLLEKIPFQKGVKEGSAGGKALDNSWSYWERYAQGDLLDGRYLCKRFENLPGVVKGKGFQIIFEGSSISSIIEIEGGKASGSIRNFHPDGSLKSLHHVKNGLKQGEEILFYPSAPQKDPLELPSQSKLSLFWHEDSLHGVCKTWYENGVLESQREMNQNKPHGLSTTYYHDGSLMMVEEYDRDRLVRGTYYKRSDKQAVSRVEQGHGIATLHYGDGRFKEKINYERGMPKTGND